jgi:hypothetical protein
MNRIFTLIVGGALTLAGVKRFIALLTVAATAVGLGVSHPQTAHATLLDGTTITSHFDALPGEPGYAGPTSTVAPGTVSPYPGITSSGTFSVTYADTSIQLLSAGGTTIFASSFTFNGIVFNDTAVNFTNVTIGPASTLTGFTAADLTFTANEITANFNGLTFGTNAQLVLDLVGTTAVPEPSSLILLCVGIAGFAVLRGRAAR